MKSLKDLTVNDLDPRGCKDMFIDVLRLAVKERDIKFLKSARCTTIIEYIYPEGVNIEDLQRTIVKRAMTV